MPNLCKMARLQFNTSEVLYSLWLQFYRKCKLNIVGFGLIV